MVSYLRPSNVDGVKHAWAILSLLVKRFRQVWPQVKIILRRDSGFCRHKMLAWCERHDVGYIVGIDQNNQLNALAAPWQQETEKYFSEKEEKARRFYEFQYVAKSWTQLRRIIAKIEHTEKGGNTRYVVTNEDGNTVSLR